MIEYPHWTEAELPAEPSARIIDDRISTHGHRMTTFEMKFHRFILAEVNTHTLFSRNSASSRAIPLRSKDQSARKGMLDRLEDAGPAYPIRWPLEQPGMQGSDEEVDRYSAEAVWDRACESAITCAEELASLGVHKSVVNRLIEPFNWHVATITAVDWAGFFAQRSWNHTKDAQPEFAKVATMVEDLYDGSVPQPLEMGEWYTPYITDQERQEIPVFTRCQISSARCARTSYLAHTGMKDHSEDIRLYERLVGAPHASPLQHIATPDPDNEAIVVIDPAKYGLTGPTHEMKVPIVGNARGYMQFRHIVLGF